MKNLFLLSIIAVFAIGSVNAQEVKFGAKAGVNFASLNGDDSGELDSRTSFHIGAVAEIIISDKFSVQPELLYSGQGAKFEETFLDEKFESTLKLDYLNIPIMAKYYVYEGLSVEAGPQIGFLLSAESEDKEDGETETADVKDQISSIDFGLNFGLGYKLENGLNFAARYNLGLSNVFDDSDDDSDDFKQQNGVFQISVGYTF
ncbi:porin family protein [uncultured Algibacter sp.]|uniref:porin family protein n=1 Tax=uncultured Algibacter sp. TaxID=298659 RepID=UPI003217BD8E